MCEFTHEQFLCDCILNVDLITPSFWRLQVLHSLLQPAWNEMTDSPSTLPPAQILKWREKLAGVFEEAGVSTLLNSVEGMQIQDWFAVELAQVYVDWMMGELCVQMEMVRNEEWRITCRFISIIRECNGCGLSVWPCSYSPRRNGNGCTPCYLL